MEVPGGAAQPVGAEAEAEAEAEEEAPPAGRLIIKVKDFLFYTGCSGNQREEEKNGRTI